MKREPFDSIIKDVLEEKGRKVTMSLEKQEDILKEIHKIREKEEGGNMIHLKPVKKVLLTAAAMCVFAAFGVMAAGKIVGLRSSIQNNRPDYREFSQIFEGTEQLGFKPYGRAEYTNGLKFKKGFLTQVEGYDDSGNVVEIHPELYMTYENGKVSISITAIKPFSSDREEENIVREEEYKGITLKYKEDQYLFVPGDYEISEEQKKAQEEGKITISYGLPPKDDGSPADPEEKMIYSITWNDGGVEYLILSMGDKPVMGDSLVQMAKETIDSKDDLEH